MNQTELTPETINNAIIELPDFIDSSTGMFLKLLKKCFTLSMQLYSQRDSIKISTSLKIVKNITVSLSRYTDSDYCADLFGLEEGRLISAIAYLFIKLPIISLKGEFNGILDYFMMVKELHDSFEIWNTGSYTLVKIYSQFWNSTNRSNIQEEYIDKYYRNLLLNIMEEKDSFPLDFNGDKICSENIALLSFLKQYSVFKLENLGDKIVEAFLHGFISQSRKRGDRSSVRLQYHIGQAPIAYSCLKAAEKKGLRVHVMPPAGLEDPQVLFDHSFDHSIYYNSEFYRDPITDFKLELKENADLISDFCGTIIIDQFGIKKKLINKNTSIKMSEPAESMRRDEQGRQKQLLRKLQPPGSLSFCKLVFPGYNSPGDFNQLFETFMKINMMESEPWESMQQVLIDTLDKGHKAYIEGCRGNRTKLCVVLPELEDRGMHTNFQNCGGDLNIPFGEVFTTPVLQGTEGLLHFREISLKGKTYKELELRFENGCIVEYNCRNFISVDENKDFIRNNLFSGYSTLPMGEFAIGTNTPAYSLLNEPEILSILPILILEKLGPHFAIGDPCWAGAEDEHVYNLIDGKEITAKENERTRLRKDSFNEAYTNLHVDMTLPFEEVGRLYVVDDCKNTLEIIRDGRLMLSGLEEMNQYLL